MDWLFPIWKTIMTGRKRKKKEKLIGLLQFLWVDFLRGESFLSLSYPVLLQSESQAFPDEGGNPQASWGMTASWRSNPQAGQGRLASWESGPWAGQSMLTSWDPWIGGSLSRLSHDNLSRTISLGGSRQVNLLGPLDCSWATPRSPAWPVMGRIQFSSVAQSCLTLWPHESQHARPPCPSPTPGVYSNSCPLSQWCHSAISFSVIPFSSCPQSIPASGSFQMSQFFTWGGQSIGVSASASVLPMNIQD